MSAPAQPPTVPLLDGLGHWLAAVLLDAAATTDEPEQSAPHLAELDEPADERRP